MHGRVNLSIKTYVNLYKKTLYHIISLHVWIFVHVFSVKKSSFILMILWIVRPMQPICILPLSVIIFSPDSIIRWSMNTPVCLTRTHYLLLELNCRQKLFYLCLFHSHHQQCNPKPHTPYSKLQYERVGQFPWHLTFQSYFFVNMPSPHIWTADFCNLYLAFISHSLVEILTKFPKSSNKTSMEMASLKRKRKLTQYN